MSVKSFKEEPHSWRRAQKFMEEIKAKGGKARVEVGHNKSHVYYELPTKKKPKK